MMMVVMVVVVIKNLTVNMKNNARGDIGLDFASGTQIPDTTDWITTDKEEKWWWYDDDDDYDDDSCHGFTMTLHSAWILEMSLKI